MKYGILLFSLLLFGCDSSVGQRELDEIRKEIEALSLEAQQYDEDYQRQTDDFDRQTHNQ